MSDHASEIIPVNIEDEMKRSYMDYAMSVIIARALPDVRDGLKPVQRRILVAMDGLRLGPNSRHLKSSKVVGETMGNYHPHGDAALYGTMVNMAQDFSIRYPLVDGQGNMGSIDGDPPAAMRYTEARMSRFATEMLADLDKDTVDWQENYDQSRMEPMVLPGAFPNLLANGTTGIAVGMATNIPPQNLTELCNGLIHLIDHPSATVEDLMQHVKGPDFPTAGVILGVKGIRSAYETGRGQIIMQGQTNIEPIENGKSAIVITDLPYRVNKTTLIERIANLAKLKKVDGITDIQDYSDRTGMRIVVELRRDAHPKKVLNHLLKHTPLRSTFGVIMLALDDGVPRVLNLQQMMQHFVDHRVIIVTRRIRFELKKALDRAHILEGLRIALDFLDEIIQLIRRSQTSEEARIEMMARYGLTQIQAEAILNMQLRQLTALEREKLENEYKELMMRIAHLEDLLSDPMKILAVIKGELKVLKEKYGDERRTRIVQMEADEIGDEDLIPEEETIVTITRDGYIKRVPIDTYRSQRRGGKGIIGTNTKEEDTVEHLFVATTHHYVLFFTNRGRVYRLKVYELPQTSRTAMGTAIINLLSIEPGDVITAVVPIKEMEGDGFLIMATENGEVKKTNIKAFTNLRANGLRAFNIGEGDELKWVALAHSGDEIVLVTRDGMSIRFHEEDVRAVGRPAGGVRGIRLREGDKVVGMALVRPDSQLLCATETGFGKRTPLVSYRKQKRGGYGLKTMQLTNKTGKIIGTKVVELDDKMIIITEQGIMIKIHIKDIRSCGRSTQGVRLIRVTSGDKVSNLARIPVATTEEEEESSSKKKK